MTRRTAKATLRIGPCQRRHMKSTAHEEQPGDYKIEVTQLEKFEVFTSRY